MVEEKREMKHKSSIWGPILRNLINTEIISSIGTIGIIGRISEND